MNFSRLSHLIYGISLWQPWQANTPSQEGAVLGASHGHHTGGSACVRKRR